MRRYAISLLVLPWALSCGGDAGERGEMLAGGDGGAKEAASASDAGATGDAMPSPDTGSPDAAPTPCVQVEVPDLVTIADWNGAPDLSVPEADYFTADVEADGTRAYFLTQYGALLGVLDIGDPSNPVLLDVVENLPAEGRLLVSGGHAYVSSHTYDTTRAPVNVLDVSTIPVVPEGVWHETGGWPCGAAPNVLLATSEGLVVLDATNPASLSRAGTLGISAYNCVAQGNVAYVASGSEFSVVDLTQPDRPTLLTRASPALHETFWLAVSDDRLYAVGGRGMTVFDVSNPSAPVELGTVDVGGAYATHPIVVGRHVYVASSPPDPALQVVDVSDPTRPMLVASSPMETAIAAVAASGNTLLVGTNDGRLRILSIQGTRSECLPVPACQSVACRSLPDLSIVSVTGCCASDTCGLDLTQAASFVQVPSACVALSQPGEPDPTCPGIQASLSIYGTEYFEGCCRPNGLCGLNGYIPNLDVDFGCMDPEGWVPDGTEPPARCWNGADAGPGASLCEPNQGACDGNCFDLLSDSENCGGCGRICAPGEYCNVGSCQPDPSFVPCLPNEERCPDYGCVDLRGNPLTCGSCDNACAFHEECRDGVCAPIQCTPGSAVCPDIGCTPLQTDRDNCGACGVRCGPYETCIGGFCTPPACAPDETYCYDLGCLNLSTDLSNCGGCENVCPVFYECVDGRCTQPTCRTGETFCEYWGCVDLQADIDNCGGCDNYCEPYYECNGGTCEPPICAPRETFCPYQGCKDLQTDTSHCGACDQQCPYFYLCSNGSCVQPNCNPGTTFCEGSGCVDLQTTRYHCGDCNTSCGSYSECVAGACNLPACPPNHTFCTNWGSCLELATNPLACGQCSIQCGPNSLCVNGVCVYP